MNHLPLSPISLTPREIELAVRVAPIHEAEWGERTHHEAELCLKVDEKEGYITQALTFEYVAYIDGYTTQPDRDLPPYTILTHANLTLTKAEMWMEIDNRDHYLPLTSESEQRLEDALEESLRMCFQD